MSLRRPNGRRPRAIEWEVDSVTIRPMEHVGIVVDDLEAATAFFVELGLTLQGSGSQ